MKLKFLLLVCFILAGVGSVHFISAEEKVNINTAPLEDLVKIIHVGEARALELISLRPFSSLDELTKIKGIGKARLEDIKKQGLAWVESAENGSPQVSPNAPLTSEVGALTSEVVSIMPAVITEILPSPARNGDTSFLTWAAAVFTSFLSGGIILILKHVRT